MRISHLEAKYGIEEIEDVLEPSELETGLIQEPTPDISHIDDAIIVRDNLGAIAEQAEEHPEVALEHYHWALGQMLKHVHAEVPNKLSLENFSDTRSSRRNFINTVRSLERHIDNSIQVSLEEFSNEIDSQLQTVIKANTATYNKLRKAIIAHIDKPVVVTNKTAFSVFVINDELIDDVDTIEYEVKDTIDYICELIIDIVEDENRGRFNIGKFFRKGNKSIEFLMNRELLMENDTVRIVQRPVDVEKIMERGIKSNAAAGLISNGVGFFLMYRNPDLGSLVLKILNRSIMALNVVRGIKSVYSFFTAAKQAETEVKKEFKGLNSAMRSILDQSKQLPDIVRTNERLKKGNLERSVRLQLLLLETVKYINDVQNACADIYVTSAKAAEEAEKSAR